MLVSKHAEVTELEDGLIQGFQGRRVSTWIDTDSKCEYKSQKMRFCSFPERVFDESDENRVT